MTVNHIARALALTLAICMAQSIVASASKPTAAQLAYANTFKDVGKNRPADSIPADHFAESRDISHAAAKLHKESAAAEKEFTKAAKGFVDATSKSLADSYEADHGVKAEDETTLANTLRPVNIKESKKIDKAQESCSGADCAYAKAIAKTYHTSLLEVAAKAQSKAEVTSAASGCEVCVYVVENKQMHQPFLCRGLKDPAYQQTVSNLLHICFMPAIMLIPMQCWLT